MKKHDSVIVIEKTIFCPHHHIFGEIIIKSLHIFIAFKPKVIQLKRSKLMKKKSLKEIWTIIETQFVPFGIFFYQIEKLCIYKCKQL